MDRRKLPKLTDDLCKGHGQYPTKKQAVQIALMDTITTGRKHYTKPATCPRVNEDFTISYYRGWVNTLTK